jgi:hypothetical protein
MPQEFMGFEDFLELWKEKLFLGQEFLTWLWLSTEMNNRFLCQGNSDGPELWFESRLQLEKGQSPNRRSVTLVCPPESGGDWLEAYTALSCHKMITKGRLRVRTSQREWSLTLGSDTLAPQSVKIMTGTEDDSETEELGLAGLFLDRVGLISELLAIMDSIYDRFLKVRLSSDWEKTELPRLKKHLAKRSQAI